MDVCILKSSNAVPFYTVIVNYFASYIRRQSAKEYQCSTSGRTRVIMDFYMIFSRLEQLKAFMATFWRVQDKKTLKYGDMMAVS